ncbi:MAG: ExbD/TolR family protein, partial [Vicinamibacteria bacterium]
DPKHSVGVGRRSFETKRVGLPIRRGCLACGEREAEGRGERNQGLHHLPPGKPGLIIRRNFFRAFRVEPREEEKTLFLKASEFLDYGRVLAILDLCRRAGVVEVALITREVKMDP